MAAGVKARLSRKADVVRASILDAAQAEFMEVGFFAASTNRIVVRCGRSKPTVFRYFPTKSAMLDAVITRIASRWVEQIHWRDIAVDDPGHWLRVFGSRLLGWILSEESLFLGRLGIAERHLIPHSADIYRRLVSVPMQKIIASRLRTWHEAGLLDCREASHGAEMFLDVAISGIVSRRLYGVMDDPSRAIIDRHINRVVGVYLRGMLPRGAGDHAG
jgi:TetR/AcrR family transcriptional regulator, mexJK operon transcriptional repressor